MKRLAFSCRAAVLLATVVVSSVAFAQAWTPGEHKGTFGFQYQYMDVGDHLLSTSNLGGVELGTDSLDFGDISSRVGLLDFDYGLTPRLALSANVSYVQSRYQESGPNAIVENPAIDDGSYHGGFQDIRLTARYAVPLGRTTITPSLGVQTATRSYPTFGHAAIGRGLDELQATLNVGHVFGLGRPTAYLQGSYTYALVEEVEGVGADRSVSYVEYGYFVTRKLNLNFGTSLQRTHGGIDWARDIHDEHDFHTHDQLAAADWWRAGVGLWYAVGGGGGVFLSVVDTLDGENTHDATAVTAGLSWRFDKGLRFVTHASLRPGPGNALKDAVSPR